MKFSKTAFSLSAVYLLIAVAVFIFHLYSTATNAADSGESAIPLYLLSVPWIMAIPASWYAWPLWNWLAYPVIWLCILFNALLIYWTVAFAQFIICWLFSKLKPRCRPN